MTGKYRSPARCSGLFDIAGQQSPLLAHNLMAAGRFSNHARQAAPLAPVFHQPMIWKSQRRKKLFVRPLPSGWQRIVETRCPFYHRLPAADRRELAGHIQVFMAEKKFEGCGGMIITDEVSLGIAAQACLLLLHRDTDY